MKRVSFTHHVWLSRRAQQEGMEAEEHSQRERDAVHCTNTKALVRRAEVEVIDVQVHDERLSKVAKLRKRCNEEQSRVSAWKRGRQTRVSSPSFLQLLFHHVTDDQCHDGGQEEQSHVGYCRSFLAAARTAHLADARATACGEARAETTGEGTHREEADEVHQQQIESRQSESGSCSRITACREVCAVKRTAACAVAWQLWQLAGFL